MRENELQFKSGDRVRILGQQVDEWVMGLKLTSDQGQIVGPDESVGLGYFIVALDSPALAEKAVSGEWRAIDSQPTEVEEINQICWAADNLEKKQR